MKHLARCCAWNHIRLGGLIPPAFRAPFTAARLIVAPYCGGKGPRWPALVKQRRMMRAVATETTLVIFRRLLTTTMLHRGGWARAGAGAVPVLAGVGAAAGARRPGWPPPGPRENLLPDGRWLKIMANMDL